MSIQNVIFYFFASVLVLSAVGVVSAKNPVKSILSLILAFFCSSVLWMMLQAEFLSLVLIFLYVGAVMVLFLFVVMMIDFGSVFSEQPPKVLALIGLLFLTVFFAIVCLALISAHLPLIIKPFAPYHSLKGNTFELGSLLYSKYVYEFEVAGAILLVAIVAAISMVFVGTRKNTKSQIMSEQHKVKKSDRLRIIKMEGDV